MKNMKIMRKSIIIFFFYSFLTSHHITSHHITSLHIVYGDMYMKCTHFTVRSFTFSWHIKSNHSLFYRTSLHFILSYFILFYLIVFILFYRLFFILFYLIVFILFYFIVFILFYFTVFHFLLFYLILFRPIRKQL